jgi:hypothetical protein
LQAENERLRIQTAAAAVRKPAAKLNSGQANILREKTIQAVGGLARWNLLAPEARTTMLGVANSESVSDKELRRFFGSTSSGVEANRLSRDNPAKYAAWKVIARERNII